MSEMALTAEHLIVIGRGRLIADTSVADFTAGASRGGVRVRTPQAGELAALLRESGKATVTVEDEPGVLTVEGADSEAVGRLAAEHRVVLFELTPHQASLEEAFMELTRDAVEYEAVVRPADLVKEPAA
jgi:ABC-2 type transport system ATP-binding protein